ncbi:MAG: hypothetical protein K0R57_5471 [Paenibacillaceae bacterium]|nr:hypothetical protein [Paenibacillaceae bacterium]
MDKRAGLGLLLIIAGVFMFAGRGNAIEAGYVFAYFWPSLFVIPMGILLHWLYFYATQRKGAGLLIPGGILLVAGLICQISMLFDVWEYTWPGFLMAVAFGLLEFYWFGGRNKWILVPVFILGSASAIFFAIFTLGTIVSFTMFGQTTVAVVLIALGLFTMIGKRRI